VEESWLTGRGMCTMCAGGDSLLDFFDIKSCGVVISFLDVVAFDRSSTADAPGPFWNW
jgi:hypothetical protein